MLRRQGLHGAVICAVLLILLLSVALALPRDRVAALAKSASIISLNTDRAAYYSGEMVTIAMVVRNSGDSNLQILCNIAVSNPAGDQVYSYSKKYDLAYGDTNSYEFFWTVPYNAMTGIYHVQSTVTDGADGRYYSSRSASFSRSSPAQSPRSATLLNLSTDRPTYHAGEVSAITVFLQNDGGSDVSVITSVEVVNPSGFQVYNGVKETRLGVGNTDKLSYTLPIPDNANNGTYQVQATIADKTDGKLYGSKSTTVYVQSLTSTQAVSDNRATPSGFKLPDLGLTGGGQYLITGLLIALAIIVIIILIRNRPQHKPVTTQPDQADQIESIPADDEKTDVQP